MVPAALLESFGKLIEYNTSCAPGFVQAAAREELRSRAGDIEELVREIKANRGKLYARLGAVDRLKSAWLPEAGCTPSFAFAG